MRYLWRTPALDRLAHAPSHPLGVPAVPLAPAILSVVLHALTALNTKCSSGMNLIDAANVVPASSNIGLQSASLE